LKCHPFAGLGYAEPHPHRHIAFRRAPRGGAARALTVKP
jgi:hypothetical protein